MYMLSFTSRSFRCIRYIESPSLFNSCCLLHGTYSLAEIWLIHAIICILDPYVILLRENIGSAHIFLHCSEDVEIEFIAACWSTRNITDFVKSLLILIDRSTDDYWCHYEEKENPRSGCVFKNNFIVQNFSKLLEEQPKI